MEKICTVIILSFFVLSGKAQNPVFDWVKQMGGIYDDQTYSMTIDADGNIYVAGYFRNTVDFDPGVSVYNLTSAGSQDIFVQKLDSDGHFLWAKQMGGTSSESAYGITIDADRNVYTSGYFRGVADFDPGASVYNLTSEGDKDVFVQKLDADGNFLWAKQLGGINEDRAWSIATDADNSVYTSGYFTDTIDVDTDTGLQNLPSAGQWDIFIQKLDTDGNFLWIKQIGGSSYDNARHITTDAQGNVYTTGTFIQTVDFDPGVSVYNLNAGTNSHVFIQKLDTNGDFIWVRQVGGSVGTYGASTTIDVGGNIYTTGSFRGTADFDPGAGVYNLTSIDYDDIYIQKLDADGDFVWAKQMGDSNIESGSSITTDSDGNVYTIGNFKGTIDFDPNVGVSYLTSVGNFDIYIQKLDADGNFIWAKQIGGSDFDSGSSIATDNDGNIYTAGYFKETVDFNLGADTTNLTSAGRWDIFIQKLKPCVADVTLTTPNDDYQTGDQIQITAGNSVTAGNTVGTGADVIYEAGSIIILDFGFSVQTGCDFGAIIGGCDSQ